jgi:hypothetical protein
MVARTPKLAPEFRAGLPAGFGLAGAILILYWTSLMLVPGTLAACGVIRSI